MLSVQDELDRLLGNSTIFRVDKISQGIKDAMILMAFRAYQQKRTCDWGAKSLSQWTEWGSFLPIAVQIIPFDEQVKNHAALTLG